LTAEQTSRSRARARVQPVFEDIRTRLLAPAPLDPATADAFRRLFAGPFLPSPLLRPSLIPVLPVVDRLVLQAVHADDVAEAYRLVATDPGARGAYNVAAEPVLGPRELGDLLGARPVRVPAKALRAAADLGGDLPAGATGERSGGGRPKGAGPTPAERARAATQKGGPTQAAELAQDLDCAIDLLSSIRDRLRALT